VIVFQIHVADFALCRVDVERQTPVAGDAQAPGSFAVAGQSVRLPGRERTQFLWILHVVEEGQQGERGPCFWVRGISSTRENFGRLSLWLDKAMIA